MSEAPILDYIAANKAKEAALDTLEASRRPWLERAREAASNLYNELRQPISVVDVRAVCPPPENVDPRVMGAIFRKSQWTRVGYASSCRVACHGRAVGLFVPASGAKS